jgi:hypothetical protein
VVPEVGYVSARPRRSEHELVSQIGRHLESRGYRVYVNPDGSDYFDLVARREDEVGLVEAKVSDARTVLSQALRRRVWGDWTAVALPGPIAARRLHERTRGTRAEPIGIWVVGERSIDELRVARPWVAPGADDPYAGLRARFREILRAIDRGDIPASVGWEDVPGAVRRASGGRRFAEWRLDESGAPPG